MIRGREKNDLTILIGDIANPDLGGAFNQKNFLAEILCVHHICKRKLTKHRVQLKNIREWRAHPRIQFNI